MKRLSSLVLIVFLVQVVMGQQAVNSIQIIAKPKKEGVWIRWAPANQTVWQLGNKHGYVLERFTLNANGEIENKQGVKISEQLFKPLSSSELMKLSETVEEAEALNEIIYDTDDVPSSSKSIAQILSKKEELENRFGVALLMCDLNPQAAEAAGLFAIDNTAVQGQQYIYRVRFAQSTELDVKPGVVVVDVSDEKPLMTINDLHAEFRDSTVMLRWSTMMHHGIYSLYNIERSLDGKVFKRVTDRPYAHMSQSDESGEAFFMDSLDVNDKTYFYRISGITPFGETGPPSNIVQGEGKNNLAGLLIIRGGKIIPNQVDQKQKNKSREGNQDLKGSKVNLTWEFPSEEERQITGFVISHAPTADGPYTEVASKILPDTRNFTDVTTFQNTYYRIVALDKSNNEVTNSLPYLVQVEDNTPPRVPEKILGSISLAGMVTLSWTTNVDPDLMGYRVFRSNSSNEEPVEITKLILDQPRFTDTVNMNVLNKKIFYRVVAVDKNYNASDYSAPLTISRPDRRPPVPPFFTKVEILRDSVVLNWVNSPSDDVAKYTLIRSELGFSRTMVSWTQAERKSTFYDKPEQGRNYQYRIEAIDSAGNKSEVITSKIFFETGCRAAVQEIKTTADRENGTITLSWENKSTPLKCIIYRKENNNKFRLYKTFDGDVNNLIDSGVAINNFYSYRIQLIYSGGVKSILSKEVEVKF